MKPNVNANWKTPPNLLTSETWSDCVNDYIEAIVCNTIPENKNW